MPRSPEERKIIETRALNSARSAGVPIPAGEFPGEEPDFSLNAGALGVEVTELLRPASSNWGIVPVAAESYHQEILQMAQKEYFADPNAKPAKIVLYFANARGKKRDKREMARTLAAFVRTNIHKANPVVNFEGLELPEGFGSMSITAELGDWLCGERGSVSISDIREALGSIISSKNKLVPTYRKNLAPGAQVWLLLYSTVAVSRSMPIPHGIEEWRFAFDFDRVFWFAFLENEFVEIHQEQSQSVEHSAITAPN
jgi:hypothetical protein